MKMLTVEEILTEEEIEEIRTKLDSLGLRTSLIFIEAYKTGKVLFNRMTLQELRYDVIPFLTACPHVTILHMPTFCVGSKDLIYSQAEQAWQDPKQAWHDAL